MKNLIKKTSTRLLKVAAVGLFVFAMAFGASTTVSVSKNNGNAIELESLFGNSALGESGRGACYKASGSGACDNGGSEMCC